MYKVILLCLFVQTAYSQPVITRDTCPKNAFYVSCMPLCERKCHVFSPFNCGIDRMSVLPPEMCHPGCACKFGYYKNAQNKCVTFGECGLPGRDLVFDENKDFVIHQNGELPLQ